MMHPTQADLALFASSDLGWWARRRVERHVAACATCHAEVAAFEDISVELKLARQLPADLDLTRLSVEMAANIRVGLAAAEAITPRKMVRSLPAAAAVAFAALALVCGWMLRVPAPQALPDHRGISVHAGSVGIELEENGSAMTLLHRRGGPVTLSVSMGGSVRARYIDADTGQVTINNVYTE